MSATVVDSTLGKMTSRFDVECEKMGAEDDSGLSLSFFFFAEVLGPFQLSRVSAQFQAVLAALA